MNLTKPEYQLYYKLHFSLLYFVDKKYNILHKEEITSPKEFQDETTVEEKYEVRSFAYEFSNVIAEYLEANPDSFSKMELDIIAQWKNFIKDRFYIIEYRKDFAVFLNMQKSANVYGVKALESDFREVIDYPLPISIEAVLLPFKEHIIYDGLIRAQPMLFGFNMSFDIFEKSDKLEATYGIISSPAQINQKREKNYKTLLKYYIKNEENREYFSDEINKILAKHHELYEYYHYELGKINARSHIKNLRKIGVANAWFGTFQGIIVASALSKKEAEEGAKRIIPKEYLPFIYYFHIK